MLQEGCFLKILIDSFRLRKWQITPSYKQTIHDCHMVHNFFFYLFHNKLNLRGDEGRKNKCKFFSYLTATRTDDEFLSSSLIFEKILVLLLFAFAAVCLDDFVYLPFVTSTFGFRRFWRRRISRTENENEI